MVFLLVTGLPYILMIFLLQENVSLQVTSLLYVHGFIMRSPLFKVVVYHYRPIFDKNKIQVKNIV